jgi:hypothetical protein
VRRERFGQGIESTIFHAEHPPGLNERLRNELPARAGSQDDVGIYLRQHISAGAVVNASNERRASEFFV